MSLHNDCFFMSRNRLATSDRMELTGHHETSKRYPEARQASKCQLNDAAVAHPPSARDNISLFRNADLTPTVRDEAQIADTFLLYLGSGTKRQPDSRKGP